jgi:hypothetical protein
MGGGGGTGVGVGAHPANKKATTNMSMNKSTMVRWGLK